MARIAVYFQMTLAVVGVVEVLRCFFGVKALLDVLVMIVVSVLALIANGVFIPVAALERP